MGSDFAMAACCPQSSALLAPETSSYASTARACSSSSSSSSVTLGGRRWSGARSSSAMARREHLGTRLVVLECGAVASRQRATGLVVEAAKRVSSGRSYALSSTLKIEDGKEEEVTALCKKILEWAHEKRVRMNPPSLPSSSG